MRCNTGSAGSCSMPSHRTWIPSDRRHRSAASRRASSSSALIDWNTCPRRNPYTQLIQRRRRTFQARNLGTQRPQCHLLGSSTTQPPSLLQQCRHHSEISRAVCPFLLRKFDSGRPPGLPLSQGHGHRHAAWQEVCDLCLNRPLCGNCKQRHCPNPSLSRRH